MKPFTFSLASVLQLRTTEQQKAREAYAAALHVRTLAAEAVRRAQAELESCHAALSERRGGRSNRNEQILMLNAVQYQQALCQRMTADLAKADQAAQARCAVMLVAQRKCEALLRLKERQQRAHAARVRQEEDAAMHDLISARHVLRVAEGAL